MLTAKPQTRSSSDISWSSQMGLPGLCRSRKVEGALEWSFLLMECHQSWFKVLPQVSWLQTSARRSLSA